MDLRGRGRSLSLIAVPLGLCLYPAAALAGAICFLAVAPPRRRVAFVVPALLIWSSMALSAAVSGRVSQIGPTVLLLGLLGALLLMWHARIGSNDLVPLAFGLAVGMIVVGTLSVIEVFVFGQPRATAGQFHGNMLGSVVAVSVPYLVACAVRKRQLRWRLLLVVASALGIVALILSGSRGALLALVLAFMVLLTFVAAQRGVLGRAGIAVGMISVASLVMVLAFGPGSTSPGRNLLVNASFESGAVGWELGGRSALEFGNAPEGNAAVALVKAGPGTESLLRAAPVVVNAGEVYTVSLRILVDSGFESGFIRVEALDIDQVPIARAGQERWAEGIETRAGGFLVLPQTPDHVWQTVVWTLPETPPGTHFARLSLVSSHSGEGRYALVDALQLEMGASASAFEPGPRPGLTHLVGPLVRRLPLLSVAPRSATDRLQMWGLALAIATDRPFLGHGLGAFSELAPKAEPSFPIERFRHSHNLYLEFLLDGGSLLAAAILAWAALVTRALWHQIRRQGSIMAAAACGVLVGSAAHNAVDVLLAQPVVLGLTWMVLATGLADGERVVGAHPTAPSDEGTTVAWHPTGTQRHATAITLSSPPGGAVDRPIEGHAL